VRCLEVNTMAAQWTHCGRSNLGGKQTWRSEHKEIPAVPKSTLRRSCSAQDFVSRRPELQAGKADDRWEETSTSTVGDTGVWGQTSKERFVEITSGRTISQQGLAATCKDPSYKAMPKLEEREVVRRMGPYERRRRGNALRSGDKHRSRAGNTEPGQRDPGRLAVAGDPRTQIRIRLNLEATTSIQINQQHWGVYMPVFKLHGCWKDLGGKSQGQNRTRENRPSGIAGGSWETWHHGEIRNPHRVPKGRLRSLFA